MSKISKLKNLQKFRKLKVRAYQRNNLLKHREEKLLQIHINNNIYSFKVSETGYYLATNNYLPLRNEIFNFNYMDKNISIYSDILIFNFGIYKFIQLAKMYALIEKKLYYKVYEEFKYYYTPSLLKSVSYHFKKEEYINFLIETQLGSFDNEEIDYTLDLLTSKFFEESTKFYTHVVGLKYYVDFFDILEFEEEVLYLVWENENKYDQNAIVVLNQEGKKLGYIRKTISKYLVKKFKYTPVLTAKVLYADEDNIYIEVNLGNT